ncbi:MAG: 4-hydroxy-tetrahydrodipicolinate synthase [Elusimicrobia bacterium]|nr:4-hydroxy-tetrahydrodipicolinate synthase [Elusimicrobiota bacterium]
MKIEGCYTAVVTPFKNNKIDFKSYENLLKIQLESGISGVVPCGSTGEGSILSPDEYTDMIKFTVNFFKGRKQVICGFGTNSTEKSLKTLMEINDLGADAILAIVPYYNKPTQSGMIEHFSRIAENTGMEIILYNIPSRTGVNMIPQTVKTLSEKHKNIVAVKEASGNLDQVSEIINICSKDFTVLSGDDSLTLPMMSVGARGVISVASNIIPDDISDMCNYFKNGDIQRAINLHQKNFKLIKNLFIETNPIPVKYALKKMGIIDDDELRLPLTRLEQKNREKLDLLIEQI